MSITTETIQEQIPYYLTQEAKRNLIDALNKFPKFVNYYIDLFQDEVLQGDCWTSVEVVRFCSSPRFNRTRMH